MTGHRTAGAPGAATPAFGAESVGTAERLEQSERLLLAAIRRWADGPEGMAEVWSAFAGALGPPTGRAALRSVERYLAEIAGAITRPLYRHGAACPCLGRDEAVMLALVRHAGAGEAFEASVHAAALVREARVGAVVAAAGAAARALAGRPDAAPEPPRREPARDARFRRLH